MKSLEVVAIILILGGLILVVAYPDEASSLAVRVLNSIRWIHNDVPRSM
jgi:hypothetical protein